MAQDQQQAELEAVIDALELSALQKTSLKGRWLDQLVWMEHAAVRASRWYHSLRVIMIVGGILLPASVSLGLTAPGVAGAPVATQSTISWLAFGLGLVVALCTALQEFFKFGDRWRHYRGVAETLKSEGWQFFQLSGPYRRYASHDDAYSAFATRVETLFEGEVKIYLTDVAAPPGGQEGAGHKGAGQQGSERNGGSPRPSASLQRQ